MLTLKETPKEPCCEKCGQSLPTPPPLTLAGKISKLKSAVSPNLRNRRISLHEAFLTLLDILAELEARPAVNFNPLWTPPIQVAPLPNVYPPIVPIQPTTGDPVCPTYPTVTCRNTAEKTTYPHAKIEAVNAVSDATGFVEAVERAEKSETPKYAERYLDYMGGK